MKRPALHRSPTTRIAALALAGLVGACAPLIKGKDEPQDVVNAHVVGMQVGDFFQRFGPLTTRVEESDGSTTYTWQSVIGQTPPGQEGLDERVCRLRLNANNRGKIIVAQIAYDYIGRLSTSRCKEMFLGA